MTLDELKRIWALLNTINQDIISLRDKATKEADPTKKSEFASAVKVKEAEFLEKRAIYEAGKADIERQRLVDEVQAQIKADVKDKDINPGEQPGSSKIVVKDDVRKDEIKRKELFFNYVQGIPLDGNARDAITPTDPRYLHAAPGCVLLPGSMAKEILRPARPSRARPLIIRSKDDHPLLIDDSSGYSTDSGAANLFYPEFHPQLIQEPVIIPTLWDMATHIPATAGKAVYPTLYRAGGTKFGGVAFTWKAADGLDKGETLPYFGQFEVTTNEVSGWTELSLALLNRNAVNIESLLTTLFRNAVRYQFSEVLLTGDGSNKPQGIIDDGNTALVKPHRATTDEISYADLISLKFGISKGFRSGAIWIMHDNAEEFLAGVVDGMDRPLFAPDTASESNSRFLGRDYQTHDYSTPDLGDLGDVTFGNPANYAVAVESDVAIARSDHAEFKKGLVVFRLIAMVGGKPIFGDAFAALDVAE